MFFIIHKLTLFLHVGLRSSDLQQLCFIFENNNGGVPLCLNSVNTGHNLDVAKSITYLGLIWRDNKIHYLYKISLLTKYTTNLTVCFLSDMFHINVFRLTCTDRT